jgi:hypothetical protein
MVSFRLRSLYSASKSCSTRKVGDWVSTRASLDGGRNLLPLPETEPRLLGRLAPRIVIIQSGLSSFSLDMCRLFIYFYSCMKCCIAAVYLAL